MYAHMRLYIYTVSVVITNLSSNFFHLTFFLSYDISHVGHLHLNIVCVTQSWVGLVTKRRRE